MILNIQFQVAGLILVMLVGGLLLNEKTLRLYTESVFVILLCTVILCISLDIASVFALNFEAELGEPFVHLICKMYLFSIVCVAYMLLMYTLTEVHRRKRQMRKVMFYHSIPLVADLLLLVVLPIYEHLEGREVYTYGPSVQFTYLFALIYLADSLYYTIAYRNRTTRQRRESVWFLLGAWTLTAVIQMMHNELLLVGFAMAVAMVFMYMKLENPENNLDKITDSFNSYAYFSYLQKLTGMDKDFSMVTLSIEGMRFINENFGIRNGNVVLKQIADYLTEIKGSKVFRTSESEFILIFEDSLLVEDATERILRRFEEPWNIKEVNFNLQVYITYLPSRYIVNSADEITEVLHYFMVECKKRGKGTIVRIDETEIEKKRKVGDAERALRWALENDKVQIYYQPIYSIKDGNFNSLEALVRIVDKNNNFMMPDIFIPIAEQNGLILELGMAVFTQVCRFMKTAHLEEHGIEYVEVNLSVIQCMQDDLSKQLLDVMALYDIEPYKINFEITETAAANSESTLLHNMKELLKVGSSFSLDDYGSGYSNLSYVVGLPFHIIKLDKNMVWSYFTSEKAEIAMKYAISMVREIGMKTVAEGVETKEQYSVMKELGVDYIQGFYFSRPLPQREVIEFLDKWL